MNKNITDENFNFLFKSLVYKNIMSGIETYQTFINRNKDFFDYPKGTSLHGRLLTCAVENSFYKDAFKEKALYTVKMEKLNDFGYNGLYLRNDDFILNIARTNKPYKLPSKSIYRKNLSLNNSNLNLQLEFDTLTGEIYYNNFNYAIITYGYFNDTLTHLSILVPSSSYDSLIYENNFINEVKVIKTYIPEEEKEEQIAKLKKKASILIGR